MYGFCADNLPMKSGRGDNNSGWILDRFPRSEDSQKRKERMTIKMDIRPAVHDPVNCKVLTQHHLNFDVRYQISHNVITHKFLLFNTHQVHPSVARCCGGKCVLDLCRLSEVDNGQPVEDYYDPSPDMEDPLIGKLIKENGLGEITFHDLDGSHPNLDLNWKRL